MARLKINLGALIDNIHAVETFMAEHDKSWSLVIKALGTNRDVLRKLLEHPAAMIPHSIAVSQLKALRLVKEINPELCTFYIKPPVLKNVSTVVRYADISVNSSYNTIAALSAEAVKQKKLHKVIVMVEMGELREGIAREGLVDFYRRIFKLPGIRVLGLGTNLGCMYGIQPTYDKLIQLVIYKQLIEVKFKRELELISGASSITIPLLQKGKVPKGIDHFRLGEAVLLGTTPLNGESIAGLSTEIFSFEANIVEIYRKEPTPDGTMSHAAVGSNIINDEDASSSFRAVVDFGILDVDPDHLIPCSPEISFAGNSSDLSVYDLGDNPGNLHTGDTIRFFPDYMGVARSMYSNFVEKVVILPSEDDTTSS